MFAHDNFHITFPNQLRAKIQYEFGNQPIGAHKRISAVSQQTKTDKKSEQNRRRLNSEMENSSGGNLSSLANIYSKSGMIQVSGGGGSMNESSEPSQRTKIVPPPASLTSEMHDRKLASAADLELQMLSPVRQIHAASPDDNSIAASPVR